MISPGANVRVEDIVFEGDFQGKVNDLKTTPTSYNSFESDNTEDYKQYVHEDILTPIPEPSV